jgi:hypothetical protein
MKSALSLTLIVCMVASALPVTAQAQADASGAETTRSWDALVGTVKTGEKVTVTLMNATNVEGKLAATTFSPRAALSRRSILTGGLIGFGIGGALGMTVGQEACLHEARWHCLKVGMPFAAIGALIGWLHN